MSKTPPTTPVADYGVAPVLHASYAWEAVASLYHAVFALNSAGPTTGTAYEAASLALTHALRRVGFDPDTTEGREANSKCEDHGPGLSPEMARVIWEAV